VEPRSRSTSAAAADAEVPVSPGVRGPDVTWEGGARCWTDGRSGFRVVGGGGRGTVGRNGSGHEGSGVTRCERREEGQKLVETSQQIHRATHLVYR
jgi:hypothetical protein